MRFWKILSVLLVLTGYLGAASGHAAPRDTRERTGKTEEAQKDTAALYQEGVEALNAEDYRKAERRFRQVLDATPDDPAANYMMGRALMGRDRPGRAQRYFRRAIEHKPDFIDAHLALGLAYVKAGDMDEARAKLEELRRMLAECERVQCGVEDRKACSGEVECAQPRDEQLREAIRRLEKAIEGEDVGFLSPAFETASGDRSYVSAVALLNAGKFRAALHSLERAYLTTGPHADLFNYMGFAHRKLGHFDTARAYYAEALALDPDHLGAHEYLGELYIQTGELDKARAQLARLDALCAFGCAEREDLARRIEAYQSSHAMLHPAQ